MIYSEATIQPFFDTVAFFLKKPCGRFVLSRYNKWSNVNDAIIIKAAKEWCLHCTQGLEGIYTFHWNKTEESGETNA